MTDPTQAPDAGADSSEATPVGPITEDAAPAAAATDESPQRLRQTVEVREVGPCKKHIKVTIDRADIDDRLGEKFSELVADSTVAGFRPGKAPRRVIERRFGKDVSDQVKSEVLLASLQQLGEENDIAPLSSPNLDPAAIELPAAGPMTYEFEVEVRPDFELPMYKGLKLRRPVHTFTDDEVSQEERRLLAPYGQVVPKPEGNAQLGDILIADVTTRAGNRTLGEMKEAQFRVERQIAFKDAVAPKFLEQVKGVNAGETRTVDIQLSTQVGDAALRGATVQATFVVKDVKSMRLPELTHEFCHQFHVHSAEELHELVRVVLNRRLEYNQRQSARDQVMEQIAAASSWELPEDLLARQARKTLARKAMEMRSDGISEAEVASRLRLMQQDVLSSTAAALKEHFVLQKIAETEKIEVNDDDLNQEIERLAEQSNESPRRLRARLEREDLLDTVATELVERKALDLILESAEYEDFEIGQTDDASVSSVEAQAVEGAMQDPTATPPAEAPTTPSS